jgi:hypothetical protein
VLAEPGDLQNDDTLWFGSMFALSGEFSDQTGRPDERAVDLARTDFARISRGLPSPDGIGVPRPIGVVSCDDARDPRGIASYLADLQVPAIIGFGSSEEVLSLAPSFLVPKKIVGMVTDDGSPLIATLPQPRGERFTWRTNVTSLQTGPAAALLVPQVLEPLLRAKGTVRPGEALRVAFVRFDSVQSSSLTEVLFPALRFNDKPALENNHDFQEVVIPFQPDSARDRRAVEVLKVFEPHVVVYDNFAIGRLLGALEHAFLGTSARPYYISTEPLGDVRVNAVLSEHVDASGLRARFFGMFGRLNTPSNLRFTLHFNEGLEKPVPYTMVPSGTYDGFYLLVYAAYLAILRGDNPVTGSGLSRAIASLQGQGPRVEVGPWKILRAFDVLRNEHTLALTGTASDLKFDPSTGDVTSDVVASCMEPVPRTTSFEPQEIPLVFSAKDRKWNGTLRCP